MEEKKKILDQLQEGKITPEGAVKQLDALKPSQESECCKIIMHMPRKSDQSAPERKKIIIKTDCCDMETVCCDTNRDDSTTCCNTSEKSL